MVPHCLLWCLWRERNASCFEDLERSLEELKSFFFFSLFTWTADYLAPLVINFPKFLVLFSSSNWVFSCIHYVYYDCLPLCFLVYTILLIKNKKHKRPQTYMKYTKRTQEAGKTEINKRAPAKTQQHQKPHTPLHQKKLSPQKEPNKPTENPQNLKP